MPRPPSWMAMPSSSHSAAIALANSPTSTGRLPSALQVRDHGNTPMEHGMHERRAGRTLALCAPLPPAPTRGSECPSRRPSCYPNGVRGHVQRCPGAVSGQVSRAWTPRRSVEEEEVQGLAAWLLKYSTALTRSVSGCASPKDRSRPVRPAPGPNCQAPKPTFEFPLQLQD